MNTYTIFGGSLRSELEFPSLRRAGDSSPMWTLRQAPPGALPSDARLLGADTVDGAVRVHLYRSAAGWHSRMTTPGDSTSLRPGISSPGARPRPPRRTPRDST